MTNLTTMIDNVPLSAIEKEIVEQIDAVIGHPDRLKAAIMLCMLSESTMKALLGFDTQGFVDALNERMAAIHHEYDEKLATVISQLKEDSSVLSNIENAESNLDSLKKDAEAAVNRFESELKRVISTNDKSIISEL